MADGVIVQPQMVAGGERMDQLPNLGREGEMLEALGLDSVRELFTDIPESIRHVGGLTDWPPAQSEEEVLRDANNLLGHNVPATELASFLGGGITRNHVPSVVPHLISRGEFLTAYTPYQPEVSQGMLQALWEFQTMICELVGMDVSNVSMYDGATAAAEALSCSVRVHERKATQKGVVFVSELLPLSKKSVLHNYLQGGGVEIRWLKHDIDGHLDLNAVKEAEGACGVYVEQPNPLGILDEGLVKVKELIGANTALIVGVNPTSLGLVSPPGNWGADIVVGEGQPFGASMSGGGPLYGLFAARKPYLRQMPGRIVGRSEDDIGREAFCLTLSTREQHIRRHRATSNICSNEALVALSGAMHLSLLGPEGLMRLSERHLGAAQLTKQKVLEVPRFKLAHPNSSHFNEFVLCVPPPNNGDSPASSLLEHLQVMGVLGGLNLNEWYPEHNDWILVSCSEKTTVNEIEALKEGLISWVEGQSTEVDE